MTNPTRKRYNRLRTGRKPNDGYTPRERILAFVAKAECGEPEECWEWTAASNPTGYGVFWNGKRTMNAHRFAYELWVGPIPKGLTVDHLCMNTSCINPAHLEAVTHRENNMRGNSAPAVNARKTHCSRGHEYTEENTLRASTQANARRCRTCHNERRRVARR